MRHITSAVILAAAGSICLLPLEAGAQSSLVRNPLYELKTDICEVDSEAGRLPETVFRIDERLDRLDGPGDGYWQVNRNHIIEVLLKRYRVELPYTKLIAEGASVERILADAVAPCGAFTALASTPAGQITAEAGADVCKPSQRQAADSIRFRNKGGNLRFRRALLRLFESAYIGTSRDFVVVRQGFDSFEVEGNATQWSTDSYRPMLDAGADDILIRRFILDDDAPFAVLCRGGQSEDGPKRVTEALPSSATTRHIDNSLKNEASAGIAGDALNAILKERELNSLGSGTKGKLLFVKSPREFAKAKGDSAAFGLRSVGGDGDGAPGITADAALGYRLQRKFNAKQDDRDAHTVSGTLFGSISQKPTKFGFFETLDDGTTGPDEKNIAFADITAGLRAEYLNESPRMGAVLPDGRRVPTSLIGTRLPGLRLGGTYEVITDNYQFQRGESFSGDLSLPKTAFFPGFRQRQELNGFSLRGTGTEGRYDHGLLRALQGWSLEWDARPAMNFLDWDTDRTPFNFETNLPRDRIDANVFDTVLWGGDFELELLKANMFGSVLGDNWLKLSLDYTYRRGYDRGLFDGVEDFVIKDAEAAGIGVDLTLPRFKGITIGGKYTVGQDYRTLAESDVIALTFKVSN